MSKHIHVRKAAPIGDQIIDNVEINISNHIETNKRKVEEVNQDFDFDAKKLCEALYASLPGGTFDRLAGHMLNKITSSLIISRKERNGGL